MISFLIVTLLLIAVYTILITQGIQGIKTLIISFGANKRHPINTSHLQVSPSVVLQITIDALSKIGFSGLGEARLNVSGVQSLDVWVFVSSDKLTHTELTEVAPKLVSFTTVYNDNAVVETSFPFGEKIETHYYRSHTITSDIEKAYFHHVQQIKDFSERHGAPLRIETMKDYLYWDNVFRKLYAWRKMIRHTWFGIADILLLVYGATWLFIVSGFLLWLEDVPITTSLPFSLLLLLKITAPAAIISIIILYIQAWGINRETKPA